MANEQTAAVATPRKTVMKSKVVLKDAGNPKLIATLPEGQNKLVLGRFAGIASKVIERKAADGVSTHTGLGGEFTAIPADASQDITRSGVTFLPDAFQDPMIEMLNTGQAASIEFAYEVSVVKAANAAGYSWQVEPLLAPASNDPLAELLAKVASREQSMIAAPVSAKK